MGHFERQDWAITTGHLDYVTSVAFSPPDGAFLATGSSDGTARIWDVKSGNSVATLDDHLGEVNDVAFSPKDKALLATASSDDNMARLWETTSGKCVAFLEGHTDNVTSVAFSPEDGKFLATGSWDMTARVWEWKVVHVWRLSKDIWIMSTVLLSVLITTGHCWRLVHPIRPCGCGMSRLGCA